VGPLSSLVPLDRDTDPLTCHPCRAPDILSLTCGPMPSRPHLSATQCQSWARQGIPVHLTVFLDQRFFVHMRRGYRCDIRPLKLLQRTAGDALPRVSQLFPPRSTKAGQALLLPSEAERLREGDQGTGRKRDPGSRASPITPVVSPLTALHPRS
jgi:hypothetical protein